MIVQKIPWECVFKPLISHKHVDGTQSSRIRWWVSKNHLQFIKIRISPKLIFLILMPWYQLRIPKKFKILFFAQKNLTMREYLELTARNKNTESILQNIVSSVYLVILNDNLEVILYNVFTENRILTYLKYSWF